MPYLHKTLKLTIIDNMAYEKPWISHIKHFTTAESMRPTLTTANPFPSRGWCPHFLPAASDARHHSEALTGRFELDE